MSNWICADPVETCGCICCQYTRLDVKCQAMEQGNKKAEQEIELLNEQIKVLQELYEYHTD